MSNLDEDNTGPNGCLWGLLGLAFLGAVTVIVIALIYGSAPQ